MPPVDAPIAMIFSFAPGPNLEGASALAAGAAPGAAAPGSPELTFLRTGTPVPAAAEACGAASRTCEAEAMVSFARTFAKNASFCILLSASGLRTKSTAPADSASNTLTFKEETRITGSG